MSLIFWVLTADPARPGVILGKRVSGDTGSVLAKHGWPGLENAALNLGARGFTPIELGAEDRASGILEVWRGHQ